MAFDPDDLAALALAREVRLETRVGGGHRHRTIVWIVVDGDRVFVRSWRGAGARWYREAIANPSVGIVLAGRRLPAVAIPATDPDSIERASAGLLRKYAGDPATASMVRDEILDTTLRLEPV